MQKLKVTFYFKSGSTIEVFCDKIDLEVSPTTNDILAYSIKGMSKPGPNPIYIRIDDISAIVTVNVEV